MARVPYLNRDDLPDSSKDLLTREINLYRAMIHSPEGTRSFQKFANWIRFDSKLDPRLREMVILQVGHLVGSAYEYSHHVKIGKEFGVTDRDIRCIIEETAGRSTALPDLERTVLRATREMTSGLRVETTTFEALRNHFDHEHIVELMLIVSFYNGVVRFLESLAIDVEPEYEPYRGGDLPAGVTA